MTCYTAYQSFVLIWRQPCFTENKYETNKIKTTDTYDYQLYGNGNLSSA